MISNQITKFQNSKKLIEFVDKLTPADPSAYAHLHAGMEDLEKGESKKYSLIGINILDYTAGKGDASVFASFNLSPCEIQQIAVKIPREIEHCADKKLLQLLDSKASITMAVACNAVQHYDDLMGDLFYFLSEAYPDKKVFLDYKMMEMDTEGIRKKLATHYKLDDRLVYSAEKLVAKRLDKDGYAAMKKFMVRRCEKDRDGNDRRSPWQIFIDNGKAIPVELESGAKCAKKDSYISEKSASVWLSDDEIEKLFRSVCSYIRVFENTMCYPAIREGRSAYAQEQSRKWEERRAAWGGDIYEEAS
ncbi:MAG: hypothetical protein LIO86_10020 [Lachnospiraceae bacterium]|nr:hypothetical protein [Lachnospiraceae bacterium]